MPKNKFETGGNVPSPERPLKKPVIFRVLRGDREIIDSLMGTRLPLWPGGDLLALTQEQADELELQLSANIQAATDKNDLEQYKRIYNELIKARPRKDRGGVPPSDKENRE